MSYQILLIDDDPYFRSEFRDFLHEYDVREASNGRDALAILAKPHRIDLIILDEMLVGERGTDLLPKIKNAAPDTDVVILTGHSTKDVVVDALQGRAADFIEKPLNRQKTQKIISRLLSVPGGQNDQRLNGIRGKIERAQNFARRNCEKKVTLQDVAAAVNLSPKYLSRAFKEYAGMGFSDFKLKLKVDKAKNLLKKTGETIDEISARLGYENADSFIKIFKKSTGYTPNEFRRRYARKSRIRDHAKRAARNDLSPRMLEIARRILLESRDAVIETDPQGKIRTWTTGARKMYGWSGEEMLGQRLHRIIPKRNHLEQNRVLSLLREGKDLPFVTSKRITRNGRILDVHVALYPQRSAKGRLVKVIHTERNITRTKRHEKYLIQQKERAQQEVSAQAVQLRQKDQELLQQRHLSHIGRLSAMLAHELRNPLGVIRTATWNISRKSSDPSLKKNIISIESRIAESEQIINALLNYSRITMPSRERVRIRDVLRECIDSSLRRYHKRSGVLKTDLKSLSRVWVAGDPMQLRQVFHNLLNNAFQSFSGRKGKIKVSTGVDAKKWVRITVSDTGRGIPEEHLDRVFDPFFSRRKKGGTGLGLAVCKQMVELHNGRIELESEEGAGTAVTVLLPVYRYGVEMKQKNRK